MIQFDEYFKMGWNHQLDKLKDTIFNLPRVPA